MIIALVEHGLLAAGFGWVVWCWSQYTVARYESGGRLGYRDVILLIKSLFSTKPHWTLFPLLFFFAILGGLGAWGLSWFRLIDLLIITSLLLILAYVDLRVHRLPNLFLVGIFIWAFVRSVWLGDPDLLLAGLGALEGGLFFLLIAIIGRGAMGMGDVKLAAGIGALLGHPLVWAGLLLGILLGGLSALVLLALRRIGRKDYMAYGPYLVLGAWLILLRLWIPI